MKILINFPNTYDKSLNLYKVKNDYKTKEDAVIDLVIKGLGKNPTKDIQKLTHKDLEEEEEESGAKYEHLLDGD